SKTGFTHSALLCWQIDYAGGSLNVNGTIMRDTYTTTGNPVLQDIKPCNPTISLTLVTIRNHRR
ncbi:hypothetical protein FPT32_24350, partial [Salmonella enterica]|nr:hypothetical protein [Salmonella enterica]